MYLGMYQILFELNRTEDVLPRSTSSRAELEVHGCVKILQYRTSYLNKHRLIFCKLLVVSFLHVCTEAMKCK